MCDVLSIGALSTQDLNLSAIDVEGAKLGFQLITQDVAGEKVDEDQAIIEITDVSLAVDVRVRLQRVV